MKRFAILLFSVLFLTLGVDAQSFTQHIQQYQAGKGKVTVTQSKSIDDLVNGIITSKRDSAVRRRAKVENERRLEREKIEREVDRKPESKNERKRAAETSAERKAAEALAEHRAETKKAEESKEEEMHIPTVDMRKKVMRGSKKVTGYRVQAFAGGNRRADKINARKIGEKIKLRFPDQPVYVHFYSPRWICRVGNFRSYSEAHNMLKAIRKMGYRSAIIVKGKITVFE